MKNFRFASVMLALVLAFAGCKEDSEPTYTVWAGTMTNSEFTASFGLPLDDNYQVRSELTNAEWDLYRNFRIDEWKHDWTENEIYIWFLERTFGETGSKQNTTWLITVGHGLVALRRGSVVYGIAK